MPRPDPAETERFLGLLEPHSARLLALGRSLLRRRADADDAVQEAVLAAWRDFPFYRERQRFGAWIVRYLVHIARNRNRALRNDLEVPLPEEVEAPDAPARLAEELAYERLFENPETVLESVEDRLATAIRNLGEAERTVLLLRTVGELTYRELSQALSMPQGTAMSHLWRARRKLRLALCCDTADESRRTTEDTPDTGPSEPGRGGGGHAP